MYSNHWLGNNPQLSSSLFTIIPDFSLMALLAASFVLKRIKQYPWSQWKIISNVTEFIRKVNLNHYGLISIEKQKIIPLTFHSDPLLNESPKFPHNLKITGNITKKLVTGLYILFPPTVQGSVDITTRTCNKEVYYFSIAHLSITKSPHS